MRLRASLVCSVFWEDLLRQRPLRAPNASSWAGFAGPTRVINLLGCKDLAAFESEVVSTFNPTPFLPNLVFAAEPTFTSTMKMLERVLPRMKDAPVLVYLEDANRVFDYALDAAAVNTMTTFFSMISGSGGATVVCNSSAVLSFLQFEKFGHTGLRTCRFFFPALQKGDEQLESFARNGAHLWKVDRGAGSLPSTATKSVSVAHKIDTWGGNVKMLRYEANQTISTRFGSLQSQLDTCLKKLSAPMPESKHSVLWTESSTQDLQRTLSLRRDLLQMLVDGGGKVRVDSLPLDMKPKQFATALQLAALNVLSFRTEYDAASDQNVEYVVPYFPAVLTEFQKMTGSSPSKQL